MIDFYSRVRAVILCAKELEDARTAGSGDDELGTLLMEHLRAVVQLRAQSRMVAAQLRDELPPMWTERVRYMRRKLRLKALVMLRRRLSAPPARSAVSSPVKDGEDLSFRTLQPVQAASAASPPAITASRRRIASSP